MDKNTITGFLLMGIVIFAFSWLSKPSQEAIEQQRRYNDSIAAIQQQKDSIAALIANNEKVVNTDQASQNDSIKAEANKQAYGVFASAIEGEDRTLTLENDSIKIAFATKGGVISDATLKTYKDFRNNQIQLIKPGESQLNFTMVTANNRIINTKDLYFEATQVSPNRIRMSVHTDNGGELAFIYSLQDKYMVDMQIETKGFDKILAPNTPYLDAHMTIPIYQNEKSRKTEDRYSGLAYEHDSGDVEKLSSSKQISNEEINGTVKWIAFRDMFFSTIIYAPEGLTRVALSSDIYSSEQHDRLKDLKALFSLPINTDESKPIQVKMYVGPNDYSLYKSIDKQLGKGTHFSKIVDMGDWFRFINVWLVIPIFEYLQTIFSNYGIIILLLTLIIKLLLSPFTYKSFVSQAKMRVLRPQVEEINKKYEGQDKMMERQKATMELYRRAGASTMGGCLPMLLQMPFLVAMYQYFPTSINLRGESFLWAQDLSTYDDIIHFGFNIPLIGDHISLFCLLMTITQVIYMKISQAGTPQQPGMAAMKYMPYMMSIMLFVFLNQNSAGLSYYYFLSMLITIIQTVIFRYAINEDKLLAKMEENKKKPIKKSKFMQRLEEMQKQQQQMQKKKR